MVGISIHAPITDKFKRVKYASLRPIIMEALDEASELLLQDFEKTTATWRTKVVFKVQKTAFSRRIYTTSKIYAYVDQGTPPHTITPKKNNSIGKLQFQTGYRPKTYANTIASVPGGSFGPYRRASVVNHPGIKPRNFTGTIYATIGKRLEDALEIKLLNHLGRLGF